MNTKANANGMKQEGPKKQPTDPRIEVANELKQHLLGMSLTHRKLKAQIASDAKKKGGPKPNPEDEGGPGDGIADEDDPGEHEYR